MAKDERLYARFDIGMDEHPKIMLLSDSAFRVLIEATLYSRRQLTDGFLDERVALRKWGLGSLDELATNHDLRPSLERVEGGWQIRDYDKHQTTTADIEAKREAGRKGGRASGQARSKQNTNENEAPASSLLKQKPNETEAKTETETETETTTSNEVERTRKRGSRLSEEWLPSSESVATIKRDAPDVDSKAEHATFIDYWIAQPGQKGVKTNWDSTWRNWMRRKQGDLVAASRRGSSNGRQAPMSKADQNAALYLELYGGDHERTGSIQALDPGVG
jgi:general stress protein YciG